MDSRRIRELVSEHGEVRSQLDRDWSGDFTLPDQVRIFYRDIGPHNVTIDGYGNPYFLPGLSSLWDFQAGYRWNSLTRERCPDWSDDWLAVADEGGDPFIFSRSSGAILLAAHGTGVWEPEEIFSDLNSMAACLASLGCILRDAGETFTDDDLQIVPEYRELAVRRLVEITGSRHAANSVLEALGWG